MTLTQLIAKGFRGWHGVKLDQPDWSDGSHSIAFCAQLANEGLSMFAIFNAYWEPLEFELPPMKGAESGGWRRWIDTSLECPQDIVEWRQALPVSGYTYQAGPRSVVVLWAGLADTGISAV